MAAKSVRGAGKKYGLNNLARRLGPRRQRERAFYMDFTRDGQASAGVLGRFAICARQIPDTPASPPLSQT